MNEPIPGALYVPAQGQRIPMPGNLPDWPQEGQPVEILNPYQRRLVIDGDLVMKPADPPDAGKPKSDKPATTGEDSHDAQ